MQQLQVNATFPSISPDAADQFTQLAAEALATIRGEPGTLQHDWFLSDDGTRCVVRETYASSDAFLAHLAAAGPLLGRLVELGGGLELERVRRAINGGARRRSSLPAARSTATAKASRRPLGERPYGPAYAASRAARPRWPGRVTGRGGGGTSTDARVEPSRVQTAGEAGVLDLQAAVRHGLAAGLRDDANGLVGVQTELGPERPGARSGDDLFGQARQVLGATEHVDQVGRAAARRATGRPAGRGPRRPSDSRTTHRRTSSSTRAGRSPRSSWPGSDRRTCRARRPFASHGGWRGVGGPWAATRSPTVMFGPWPPR